MAANDALAVQVVVAALAAGRSIPDSLSVLGIDDDELLCQHARVPLSSLRLDLEALGGLAVEQLAALMEGRPAPAGPRLVSSARLVERASTRSERSADHRLRAALLEIRSHATTGLTVAALAAHCGTSRRILELLFRRELGCAPGDAIRQERLRLAQELLRDGDETLAGVAARCGYAHATALGHAFRRTLGETPGGWRVRAGRGGP